MSTQPKQSHFGVNVASIFQILKDDLSSNEMLALIAVSAGVCSDISHDQPTASHGENSVAKRTGMSVRASRAALENLVGTDNLAVAPPAPDGVLPDRVEATYVVPAARSPDVKLSSDLLQEAGPNGPLLETLYHLRENIQVAEGIPARSALVDAICLFLTLHQVQDFNEFSGVDPYLLSGRCSLIEAGEDGPDTSAMRPLVGQEEWSLITVKKEARWNVDLDFINNAIPSINTKDVTDDKAVRFWHALAQLRRSHLVHDVLVIWDGNPVPDTTRQLPSVWGTLYVGKRRDPNRELCLLKAVHDAAFETGTLDRGTHMCGQSDYLFEGSGRYRYVVPSYMATTARLVPQLRVRRWAYSSQNLKDLQADAARVSLRGLELERVIDKAKRLFLCD